MHWRQKCQRLDRHATCPQANWVLPRHKAIRGARARHPASDRAQNRVTARGYRLPAVDAVHLGHGCEPRPRTGLHRRGGICACAGTGTGWRAFGWVGGCEPQTLQTLFSGRTVAKCCARAPVLEYCQEGPLLPGACMRARAITIGADHHHRHNPHGRTDLRCRSESRRCRRIRSKPWNIL